MSENLKITLKEKEEKELAYWMQEYPELTREEIIDILDAINTEHTY